MGSLEREAQRTVRFLLRGDVRTIAAAKPGKILLDGGERGQISVSPDTLSDLTSRGIIGRKGDFLTLRAEGHSHAKRQQAETGFQEQHRDIRIYGSESGEIVAININESPLAQLFQRRSAAGRPFLTEAEFRAGERLRADYTRANIMPRLGANWVASVSTGRRGAAGGAAELTDAVLAARQRVEKAIAEVGPELAGVLIDVCCFLKGMETVETERRWPVRSAKLMLKTALGVLSRHYEPVARPGSKTPLHWGAAGFRPSIAS